MLFWIAVTRNCIQQPAHGHVYMMASMVKPSYARSADHMLPLFPVLTLLQLQGS